MELQLGLALPDAANNHDGSAKGHGIDLDLNMGIGVGHHGCGTDRVPQQLQQNRHHHHHQLVIAVAKVKQQQQLLDLSDCNHERQRRTMLKTLPLLHWSGGNNDRDDDDGGAADEYMDTDTDDSYHQPNKARSVNSTYVKVTMEGIGIGRKVDLSLHHSFHSLKDTLFPMFGIYDEDSDNYQLAYQDKGGQWVVAHDSSWRDLIRSTQRLKILKI